MKTKQLLPKAFYAVTLGAGILLGSSNAFAQVKIGTNPTTITPNSNLDVEGVSNRHTVVMKSGRVGIGTTTAPFSTLHVEAVENETNVIASNVIARFEPMGGSNFNTPASIMVNGGRAVLGYAVDAEQNKYAFLRANTLGDIRLQVMDFNSTLIPDAFVMSGQTGSYGFIGINNEAPQSQLDVRGTTKIMAGTGAQTGSAWIGTSNMNGLEVTTNPAGDAYVGIQRAGVGASLYLSKPAGAVSGQRFQGFQVGGTTVGSVNYDGSGVQYSVTSDQRLKENIRTSKFGLEALKAVKVYDYNFKADQTKSLSTGVLAQELHKIYPQAVTVGGSNAKNNPWQVDYSKLIPMLVKSVQELSQEVESLKSEKAQLSAELNERVSKLERLLSAGENAKSASSASSLSGSVSK
ncbi:tail fiber domain-containing protein [Dyadobacter alkalitolerans]|uniref:tail fiber domain-containing protein n=1 Tax=Dyadobacter alkalitolerans TaxID=492736 RepID=UPI000400A047|nr:tail fiber domain-containing protein [Dyadobacter alkalitolerans]